MLVMYLIYKLLLVRSRRPRFCRMALLSIYALAPLAVLLARSLPVRYPAATDIAPAVATDIALASVQTVVYTPVWPRIVVWVWIAGIVVVVFSTAVSWARVVRAVGLCREIRRIGRVRLAVTDDSSVAPFSFGRTMVISRADLASDAHIIISHELQHIRLLHTFDIVVARLVTAFCWFNPAAWLMARELNRVHEFEVDNRLIRSGIDMRRYQYMLIGRVCRGISSLAIVNGLHQSNIKLRIGMMLRPCGHPAVRWMAPVLLPAAIVAVTATANHSFFADLACLDADMAANVADDVETEEMTFREELADVIVVSFGTRKSPVEQDVAGDDAATSGDEPQPESVAPPRKIAIDAPDNFKVTVPSKKELTLSLSAPAPVIGKQSTGSPTFIIDGVAYPKIPDTLDPSDIESITVDKSTAEYPDGVIRIYLKK